MKPTFQAYLVTCVASGRHYVGITSGTLKRRWREHRPAARREPGRTALYRAIVKHGADAFTIEPLATARSWADLCAVEETLIQQWGTHAPNGYNLTTGGEGVKGYAKTADEIERSAAKHRGKPCHPNTRLAGMAQRGKPKSAEHRERIAAARCGNPRSADTKAKLAAYWAARRAAGEFKTATAYGHARKKAGQ